MYDFIYMRFLKQANSWRQEIQQRFPGPQGREKWADNCLMVIGYLG